MDNAVSIVFTNFGVILLFMTGVWLISLVKKDVSIVDGFWGLGFLLLAWITFFRADGYIGRTILLLTLTTIWGLRLSIHIFWRHWGKEEDRRYHAWRLDHGDRFWLVSFFKVFMLQGLVLWCVSLVLQAGMLSPTPASLTWLDLLGVCIWLFGFLFESIGDFQLLRFKSDPANKGKIMDRGVWAYTRHPNYFGDSVLWWGVFLITLSNYSNVWTLLSPALMTFLLLKVSGVAMLDRTLLETRPEYRDYMQRTNAFLPWFPKRTRSS